MFENLKCQNTSTRWEITEASLFIMTAVAKNILPYVTIKSSYPATLFSAPHTPVNTLAYYLIKTRSFAYNQ